MHVDDADEAGADDTRPQLRQVTHAAIMARDAMACVSPQPEA